MLNKRYLSEIIKEFLEKKMVFIGGPRQVGKTTLSLSLLDKPSEQHPAYLNWDNPVDAHSIKNIELPSEPILIFDEIHKYPRWRNLIKGIYDTHKSLFKILVTGSARLDHYSRGGDSLLGRYRYLRLHPFSLNELNSTPSKEDLDSLLKFGGFPEPLFAQNERDWRFWHRERIRRILQDDLRDLERVHEVTLIEVLVDNLPKKVGSMLSVNSLREDLQVDHKTVQRWLSILENIYICFRIMPYGAPKIRAIKKEQKLYLWDWSAVEDMGAKFENLVACQLLKYCHYLEDTEGYNMELRYIRDTDKREVDFVVLQDHNPKFAVECKVGDKMISPAVNYFRKRTEINKYYQVHLGEKDYQKEGVRVIPFIRFCQELNMP